MRALWDTFSLWEQAFIFGLLVVFVIAAAGWVLAKCADAFDLDELEQPVDEE